MTNKNHINFNELKSIHEDPRIGVGCERPEEWRGGANQDRRERTQLEASLWVHRRDNILVSSIEQAFLCLVPNYRTKEWFPIVVVHALQRQQTPNSLTISLPPFCVFCVFASFSLYPLFSIRLLGPQWSFKSLGPYTYDW